MTFDFIRAKWAALSRLPSDTASTAKFARDSLALVSTPIEKQSQEYKMLEAADAGLPSDTAAIAERERGLSKNQQC